MTRGGTSDVFPLTSLFVTCTWTSRGRYQSISWGMALSRCDLISDLGLDSLYLVMAYTTGNSGRKLFLEGSRR